MRMSFSAYLPEQADQEISYALLSDLLEDTLRSLVAFTVGVVWVWGAYIALFRDQYAGVGFALLGFSILGGWISYTLAARRLRLAIALYLVVLFAIAGVIVVAFRSPTALYLYVPLIVVAAALTVPLVTWGIALLCVLWMVLLVFVWRFFSPEMILLPSLFLFLTSFASSLSARRLIAALTWAINMTDEAQKNAREAQQHRAEAQRVAKSLEEACIRLERTNQALLVAQADARKAYRFKAEFVANVSHELRTPLNLIVGFSEMMVTSPESYGGVPLPPAYRGDLMAIYRSARHLSDLINDVLDLSRIESGQMPIFREEADLIEIAEEAISIVRGLAEARGLRLELQSDPLPPLYLDRTRIRQVLLNLLSNAVRFTDRGSITVLIRRRDQDVLVQVRDTGRGIPPDRLQQAFEAFVQLDDRAAQEGSGLGLALSRRFVELHGGTMSIESTVGKGTTVSFSLPLSPSIGLPQVVRPELRRPEHAGEPLIALYHDSMHLGEMLQRHLEACRVILAPSPQGLSETLEQVPVSVVVTSPTWLQTHPFPTLPDSLITVTFPFPDARQIVLLWGFDGYIPKPITQDVLDAALDRLPSPPQKVLVVDDDPQMVRLLARMLRRYSPQVQVLEAFSGEEGLEIAKSERPDLILLDLVMPDMDGQTVVQKLAETGERASAHIIAVSAHSFDLDPMNTPLVGDLSVHSGRGLTATQWLELIRHLLPQLARMATVVPDNAGVSRGGSPE